MRKLSISIIAFLLTLTMSFGYSFAGKLDIQLQRLLLEKIDHTNYKNFNNKLINIKVDKQKDVLVGVFIKADPKAIDKIVKAGAKVYTILSNGIMTADVPIKALHGLESLPEVARIEAGNTMKMYTDVSISSPAGLNLISENSPTGAGIIVGAVDSGIDYTHGDFMNSDGSTRIISIWDQSDPQNLSPPSGYTYGSEYTSTAINEALSTGGALAQRDTNGHGTHVMGTIAGNNTIYRGAAPEASIIMVKFDFDNIAGRNNSTYMVDGINYIFSKAAALGKAAAVNLSMGTDYGPHDGSTLVERSIDSLTGQGKIVVVAAGNASRNIGSLNRELWGDPIHGDGTITEGGSSTITCNLPAYAPNASDADYVFFDAWYSGSDICQVQITTPSGKKYPPNFVGPNRSIWKTGSKGIYYMTSEGTILVLNSSAGDPLGWGSNNGDNELYIEISDYAGAPAPAAGNWKIEIFDRGGLANGTYNSWHGTSATLTTASFLYEGQDPDNIMTVGNPASASQVVTVGAYATKLCWDYLGGIQQQCYWQPPLDYYDSFFLGDIAFFSSQGPLRNGGIKPDISAPGVGICAALSSMLDTEQQYYFYNHNRVDPDGAHAVLQGTSMACPHVTGSVALLLAKDNTLDPAAIISILGDTAKTDGYTETVPNNIWGRGKVDLDAALNSIISCDLVADFSGSSTSGCAPLSVSFTDQSTGSGINSRLWDFGDGSDSSLEQNPTHVYLSAGNYTVSLTISNADGCSDTKTAFISVSAQPVADFSGTPASGYAPLTVSFTDLSTGEPASWSWDFGDGGTSSVQNPSHDYTCPGTYTVSLIVSNSCGLGSISKVDCISVQDAPPAQTLHVAAITMELSTRRSGKNIFTKALATVTIQDAQGGPVEGATITGHWSGAASDIDSGLTGSSGSAVIESNEVKNAASGQRFTFTVDSVTKQGWTYDQAGNGETSDFIAVP